MSLRRHQHLSYISQVRVSALVEDTAIGARESGFQFASGQIRHNAATAATFLCSCVAEC